MSVSQACGSTPFSFAKIIVAPAIPKAVPIHFRAVMKVEGFSRSTVGNRLDHIPKGIPDALIGKAIIGVGQCSRFG